MTTVDDHQPTPWPRTQLAGQSRPGEPKPFDLDAFADRNTELALIALAAMAASALIALLVHLLGLTWSVPLLALPVALVSLVFSTRIGVAAAGSLLLAAVLMRHWQRADSQRGEVEAQRVRDRRGLHSLTLGGRERRRWKAERVRGDRLALGESRGGEIVTVPFGSREGVRAFIPGAPGSGKTVDLAVHARAYVAAGHGVASIDPKGDRAHRDALEEVASEHGRRTAEEYGAYLESEVRRLTGRTVAAFVQACEADELDDSDPVRELARLLRVGQSGSRRVRGLGLRAD